MLVIVITSPFCFLFCCLFAYLVNFSSFTISFFFHLFVFCLFANICLLSCTSLLVHSFIYPFFVIHSSPECLFYFSCLLVLSFHCCLLALIYSYSLSFGLFNSFFHSVLWSFFPSPVQVGLPQLAAPTAVPPVRSHTSAVVLVLSLRPQTDTEVWERLISSGVNTVFHPSICQLALQRIRGERVCGPLIVGCHTGEPGGTGLTWLFFTPSLWMHMDFLLNAFA